MNRWCAAIFLFVSAGVLPAACSRDSGPAAISFEEPETQVDYDVELTGVERESIEELMTQALEIYRQQERGAQSLAFLRRRAEGDVATVLKIMRSDGYFEAQAHVEVIAPEARAEAGPPAGEQTESQPAETPENGAEGNEAVALALVRMTVEPGKRYTLARHRFQLIDTGAGEAPSLPDAKMLGSPVGGSARADRILDAETNAVTHLRTEGRPYAAFKTREAVADRETKELEVESVIDTGRPYVYGPVTYTGVETIDRDYLDTYIPFAEGEPADPAKLTEFQRALIATGLFSAGSARFPETPPEGDVAPVLVALEEAPPRTVSAGALYSTDAGPAVTGGFEHRNLFGANETVTVDALIGLDEQSLETRYRVPQWMRPNQDLVFGLEFRHVNDDAYEEFGGTFAGGIERELSPELTVGGGGLIEFSRLDDGEGFENSYLFGVPIYANYDGTDDKLDPSTGLRLRANATPFAGVVGGKAASFLVLDGTASMYFDLTGEKRYIFAARGRIGSVVSGDLDTVAANHRLYSGGGGSVRGYKERSIGPLDKDGDPDGGLSVFELGGEMRARVTKTFGLAAFLEAGAVSRDVAPTFDESVQVAAGGGLRYFSPIGPLRVDIGVPVNPRKIDDFLQVYIAIGQAF